MDKMKLFVLAWIVIILSSISVCGYSNEYADAKTNYMLQCQGCHQATGAGMPPVTPDISEYGEDFLSFEDGRAYWISVPGASNSPLSDKALAGVLNYMSHELLGLENTALFTEVEVAKHRSIKIRDVYELRSELITQLSDK
ncbi:MAG: c-type cytochrome [Paraglaciecola sp.]|uniref:c-type cytochrome n=1 Tax=Paraglaciecola sp. TaxID=1920173 RepID=UPI003299621F